ncbi:MAG: ferrous iron transport protein A [Desulfurococcales archaeon]|nr:ferrous iron transport protein A [Desulfurococcales archaeon]
MPWGRWWRRGWGAGRGSGWGWKNWGPGPAIQVPAQLEPGTMSLSVAPPGSRVIVKAIVAGMGAYNRILSLGIAPGTELEVVENNMYYPWSPVIVRVRGVEVAIGRGLADKILVVPASREVSGGVRAPGEQPQGSQGSPSQG